MTAGRLSFIDKCRQFIGLDSTPSRGNKEVAIYLADLCKSSGLHVELQSEFLDGLEQCNVIARPSAEVPKEELLLQTHVDTVDPGHFSLWTRTQSNPFNASIYNDEMFGLGVADAKLDFLCKLEAASALAGHKLKRPFVLTATFGTHRGMAGAIKLVRKKKINAKWALIGAPTDLRLVTAAQGLAVIEIFIPFSWEEKEYRRRHDIQESASTQSRMFSAKGASENAILKMLEYLGNLPEGIAVMDLDGGISDSTSPSSAVLELDIAGGFKEPIVPKLSAVYKAILRVEDRLSEFSDPRFDPPHPTLNVGTIRTSEDGITMTGSCHLPPTVTDQTYEQWMKILQDTCRENDAAFRVRDYRKGFETGADSELARVAERNLAQLGLSTLPMAYTGATEASVFSRWGTKCIVWGAGLSVGNSHAPNESIKVSDLDKAIEFYRRFLEGFCL